MFLGVNLIDMLNLSAEFCTFPWTWELCRLCTAPVLSGSALGANRSQEEMLAPFSLAERSVEETVAGKPVLPWCLTLAVSKWSHVKPRSAQDQTRAPRGRAQEAGVQPWLSWGSRKTLPWLQGAGPYLVLLPEGYHSIPCWRTESF